MNSHPLIDLPRNNISADHKTSKRIETAFNPAKPPRNMIRDTVIRSRALEPRLDSFQEMMGYTAHEAMLFFGEIHQAADSAREVSRWIAGELRSHLPDRRTPFGHTEPLVRACRRIHARLQEHGLTCSLFYGLIDGQRRRLDYYSAGSSGRACLLRDGDWIALEQTSHALGGNVEGLGRFQSVTLDSSLYCFIWAAENTSLPQLMGCIPEETWSLAERADRLAAALPRQDRALFGLEFVREVEAFPGFGAAHVPEAFTCLALPASLYFG